MKPDEGLTCLTFISLCSVNGMKDQIAIVSFSRPLDPYSGQVGGTHTVDRWVELTHDVR